jgi:TPR repeat protein
MSRKIVPLTFLVILFGFSHCTKERENEKNEQTEKRTESKSKTSPEEKHPEKTGKPSRDESPRDESPRDSRKPAREAKPGREHYQKYLAYKNGDKVKRSEAKSKRFLNLACKSGDPEACFERAVMIDGGDMTADPDEKFDSRKEMERLCEREYAHACTRLGWMRDDRARKAGRKAKKKLRARAFDAYLRACKLKDFRACVTVAKKLRKGVGTEKDEAKAERWLKKGMAGALEKCRKGEYLECELLLAKYGGEQDGICMPPWEKCRKDMAKLKPVVQAVTKAAKQRCKEGHIPACGYVPSVYSRFRFIEDRKSLKKESEKTYLEALEQSCDEKHGANCLELGEILRRKGHKHHKAAWGAFKGACEQGLSKGCYYKKRIGRDL